MCTAETSLVFWAYLGIAFLDTWIGSELSKTLQEGYAANLIIIWIFSTQIELDYHAWPL